MRFWRKTTRGGVARSMAGGLCLAAAVLALIALGMQIFQGVSAVAGGEMTVAQMLAALGAWLCGR